MSASIKKSYLLTWGIALALVLQFVGAAVYFILFAESSFARFAYGATKVLMLVLPIFLMYAGAPIRLPRPERPTWTTITRGLAIGTTGAAAILAAAYFWPSLLIHATDTLKERAETLGILAWFVPCAVIFSLFHSLFEEYYWRWFVRSGLRTRCTPFQTAVIGSIGFASHHFIIIAAFFSPTITLLFGGAVFVAGLVWSALAKDTQGLWSSWISHALIDGALFTAAATVLLR